MRLQRSMMMLFVFAVSTAAGAGSPAQAPMGPEAPKRSNIINFKDMVFAVCIARIYQGQAAADAASSARALVDWTLYDAENGTDEIDRLITRYVQRDYRNPRQGDEPTSVDFSLLKCLDLYHSPALALLAKRVLIRLPASKGKVP